LARKNPLPGPRCRDNFHTGGDSAKRAQKSYPQFLDFVDNLFYSPFKLFICFIVNALRSWVDVDNLEEIVCP